MNGYSESDDSETDSHLDDTNIDTDADADSDTDTDVDTDTDTDVDTDTDIDTDIDVDTDADIDTDVDTNTDIIINSTRDSSREDTDTVSDAGNDSGSDGNIDTNTDINIDTDTDSSSSDLSTDIQSDNDDLHVCENLPPCVKFVNWAADFSSETDGSTWERAFLKPQPAINAAAESPSGCEVWIAKGTYYVRNDSNDNTVALRQGVGVYGGFNVGDCDKNARELTAEAYSVLSGCADDECSNDFHVNHVVTGAPQSRLDGFVITNGMAVLAGGGGGGGMVNTGVDGVVIANTIFKNNHTSVPLLNGGGGAMYNSSSSIHIEKSIFVDNSAVLYNSAGGGAIYNNNADIEIYLSVFIENSAGTHAGAIFSTNESALHLDQSYFYGNSAGDYGGALYTESSTANAVNILRCQFHGNNLINGQSKGGAISGINAKYVTEKSVFLANSAYYGSAVAVDFNDPSVAEATRIENSVFLRNLSDSSTAASTLYLDGQENTINIVNSTILGNRGGIVIGYNGIESCRIVNTVAYDNLGGDVRNTANGAIEIHHSVIGQGVSKTAGSTEWRDDPGLIGLSNQVLSSDSAISCSYLASQYQTRVILEEGAFTWPQTSVEQLILVTPLFMDGVPALAEGETSTTPLRDTGVFGAIAQKTLNEIYVWGDVAGRLGDDCAHLKIFDLSPLDESSPVVDRASGNELPLTDIRGADRFDIENAVNIYECSSEDEPNCIAYGDVGAVELIR